MCKDNEEVQTCPNLRGLLQEECITAQHCHCTLEMRGCFVKAASAVILG